MDLYESVNGLYAFTFYSRYKMPPSLMFEFIEKYKKEDTSDTWMQVSPSGRCSLQKY